MNDLTGIVKSEYELTDEEFNYSHSESATDARIIVVGVLVRDGWGELEISKTWKQKILDASWQTQWRIGH